MPRIERTTRAEEDAVAIWEYIAQDNPTAATELIFSIEKLITRLAELPESAEAVPIIAPAVRRASLGSYVLYYRPITDGIELLRVLHGAREPEDLLLDELSPDGDTES
jgi:toxin ParE1/3/4